MGYVIGFVLILTGYALIDWGHYAVQGKHVPMTYLLLGPSFGSGTSAATNASQASAGTLRPNSPQ